MTTQPEALRLADALNDWSEGPDTSVVLDKAAAELRRLHAELERCKQVCAATSEAWREEAALAEPDTCTWQQDGDSDSGFYGTSCRHYFNLEDGTPEDNKMQWCCYCGKKLAQALITEDSDE